MPSTTDTRLSISRFNFNDALVLPATLDRFMSDLNDFRITKPEEGERLVAAVTQQLESVYIGPGAPRSDERKPFVYSDGIGVIPVHGVLVNRFGYSWGFVTGYNFIRMQLRAMLADDDVKLIVFDVDSPGGDAPGCFELCEEIRASREIKPSVAVVDALCASGAFAIGTSATRMVCTPSGSVGSVGVYWIHADLSGRHEQMGVKYTIYEAPEGGEKTAGSPYGPMSERSAKEAQDRVNRRWDEFVALVATNRDLDETVIRETQARMFRADEALDLQLIDAVSTPSEAVADFLGELASDDLSLEDNEEINDMTEAEMKAQITAAREEERLAAVTASKDAVTADRKRRADIMALPAASTRQKLASTLADSDTTVEFATSILTAAAEETISAPTTTTTTTAPVTTPAPATEQQSQFTQQMNQGGGAGVTPQGNSESQIGKVLTDEEKTAAILGDQTQVTGRKFENL